uniref:Uncharacterized protein n=1 Tax=Nelumbo nucifera TaxID=4432 RepID=A0A822Z1Z2_NELNU|nr:TPA_asm: hypothetical protein HUJ06_007657 [Nelumbo nucifera]
MFCLSDLMGATMLYGSFCGLSLSVVVSEIRSVLIGQKLSSFHFYIEATLHSRLLLGVILLQCH